MTLLDLQRQMAGDVMTPLAVADHLAPRIKAAYIRPNDRLTSRARLEIYSRSYWYRVIDSMYEDFPGLCAIVGQRAFDRLVRAYLAERPSRSFTLRNLGSRLEAWLRENPEHAGARLELALDMTRLEWAHIEAFDGKAEKPIGPEDLLELGPELRLSLQPYIRLLELRYPVDDLRIELNRGQEAHEATSNVALKSKQRGAVRRVARLEAEQIFLAVHRLDFTVYYRRLSREEFRLLSALQKGRPLGQAVAASVKGSDVPLAELQSKFEAWFAAWAQMGWFCQ